MALIAFGSLLWTPPRFKRINRELTLMWALVFTAMVPSHLIAGAIDTHGGNTIFNWVIPVALIVWAATRAERVTAGDRDGRAVAGPPRA